MSVIGIDFGSKNCVISQAKRGGIDTVLNEASKRQTPALVSFQGKQRFMGVEAVPLVSSNFKNTVSCIKRFIGKRWSDPHVQDDIQALPNAQFFQEMEGDKIGISVNYQGENVVLSPEDVCAMLIGSLKRTAEFANDGRAVSDIVFSVPAFWSDGQRRAFVAACKIANVDVLGLITDGSATALSYGIWKSVGNQFDKEKKEHVMFVDMGYSSFQVTIAAFVQGKLEIVATAAEPNLGGRDFDMAIAKHCAKQFKEKHKCDPFTNPKSLLKLLAGCEKAKHTLTPEGVTVANINVEYLMNEIDFSSQLKLEDFNAIIMPLVERIVDPLEQAMMASGLTIEQLHSVEIVGGSTRIRAVKKMISDVLGLDQSKPNYGLSTTQNADECISKGCALQSAMLSPAFRVKEFQVVDSHGFPVVLTWDQNDFAAQDEDGMEVDGSNSIVLFGKGYPMNGVRRLNFRRKEAFDLLASYGEEVKDRIAPYDMSIGKFNISGFPQEALDPTGNRIRIDFGLDQFGLFRVVKAEYMELVQAPADEAKTDEDAKKNEEKKQEGEEQAEAGGEEAGDDKPAEAKEAEQPKKKKFVARPLMVESEFFGAIKDDEILNARAREEEFAGHDKVLKETSEKRNELEEYVYSMRDKIDYALKEFGTEKEREEFKAILQAAEDWLYDEGAEETKKVYVEKFDEVSKLGVVFMRRASEHEGRPKAANKLKDAIADLLKVVNSPDEKYSHIDEDERKKVSTKCEEAEKWLKEVLDRQAELNLYEDPVVTISEIDAKVKDLNYDCRPIVTKRKPPPPKEEKAPEEKGTEEKSSNMEQDDEKKTAEGEKAGDQPASDANDGENDMDVD